MEDAPIFLAIPGYPGYAISNHGEIVSFKYGAFRIRKQSTNAGGYRVAVLSVENKVTCALVHRVVLSAFVGACPDGMETRHLDGDKTNNHVLNLAWGTVKENSDDRQRHGTATGGSSKGIKNPTCKLTEEQVMEARKSTLSNQKMANQLGVSKRLVSLIRQRKIWKHLEAA